MLAVLGGTNLQLGGDALLGRRVRDHQSLILPMMRLCGAHPRLSCVRYTGNEGMGILGQYTSRASPEDDAYAEDHLKWTSHSTPWISRSAEQKRNRKPQEALISLVPPPPPHLFGPPARVGPKPR